MIAKNVTKGPVARSEPPRKSVAETLLEDAREAGLLEGETTHLSFRVPKALLEAAKRETGVTSPTGLGLLALAWLAYRDPVVEFLEKNRGALKDSDIDLDF